jgi:hypothetical protein
MGQAKRRGTREERIAQAIERTEAAETASLRFEACHPKSVPSAQNAVPKTPTPVITQFRLEENPK